MIKDELGHLADKYRSAYYDSLTKSGHRAINHVADIPFGKEPHCILRSDLSVGAKLLYGYLQSRCQLIVSCWPAIKTMADDLRLSPSYVSDLLKELEDAKLISKTKYRDYGPWVKNEYTLTDLRSVFGDNAYDSWGVYDYARQMEKSKGESRHMEKSKDNTTMLDSESCAMEKSKDNATIRYSESRATPTAMPALRPQPHEIEQYEIEQEEVEQVGEAPGASPGVPTAQVSSTTQRRELLKGSLASKVVLPEPGDRLGRQKLQADAKREQREESKALKIEAKAKRERDIVAGVLGSTQTPASAIWDTFRGRMGAANLFCEVTPSVKDRARWRAFAESMGGLDQAQRLVTYVVDNWPTICQAHPKLNGSLPGIGLFQSAWRHEFIKAVFAGGSTSKPTVDGTDKESVKYREMEELAKMMVAKKKGRPYDKDRFAELYGRGHTTYLREHLDRIGDV